MAVIGPGAQQQVVADVRPQLEDATEYEFVTVLNPLTDDFVVRVAQDIPVNAPVEIRYKTGLVQNGNDVVRNYGLDLKNKDFMGKRHVSIDTLIPSGTTKNFKGNEAQVAVRQLVNEIMQREGHAKLMSDPQLRSEVESRIIVSRGSIQDIMDKQMVSPRKQMDDAIAKSNEVDNDQPFPGLNRESGTAPGTASEDSGTEIVQPERRGPGRPKTS